MVVPAGDALPAGDPFGVSVSLPAWADTVSWAQRDPAFMVKLKTGYPRFFIPRIVEHLSRLVLEHAESLRLLPVMLQGGHTACESQTAIADSSTYSALLLVNSEAAALFRSYLLRCGIVNQQTYQLELDGCLKVIDEHRHEHDANSKELCIHVVAFPAEAASEGKSFWQHAGFGISSRFATYWLQHGPLRSPSWPIVSMPVSLPLTQAEEAKDRLRSRIAGLVTEPGLRIEPDDVFLYPTGMSAIDTTATVLQSMLSLSGSNEQCRVAIFGFVSPQESLAELMLTIYTSSFVYVDTFKVLSKIHGFDCVLYGHASSSDLDRLESDLSNGMKIQALYTEFPGNPLMISPDLKRLGKLSSRYGFPLIVDETIGTSVNLSLMPHCDILCTSLTKMFSGGCNVMGGSLALNPRSSWYNQLRQALLDRPTRSYFCHEALIMEKNSKDFPARVAKASRNAEHIAAILRDHSSVADVFYPKGSPSQSTYDRYRRTGQGYGFLVSIQFKEPAGAVAFHDAFHVAKGPSLGTNFTLCCAYTLLAHYRELEWAAEFGVTEYLVRISVGIEDVEELEKIVATALKVAERI